MPLNILLYNYSLSVRIWTFINSRTMVNFYQIEKKMYEGYSTNKVNYPINFIQKKKKLFHFSIWCIHSLKHFSHRETKFLYSFSIEILGSSFEPFANRNHFIIVWKFSSTPKFLVGTKQAEIRRGQIWIVRMIWQLFPTKLISLQYCVQLSTFWNATTTGAVEYTDCTSADGKAPIN